MNKKREELAPSLVTTSQQDPIKQELIQKFIKRKRNRLVIEKRKADERRELKIAGGNFVPFLNPSQNNLKTFNLYDDQVILDIAVEELKIKIRLDEEGHHKSLKCESCNSLIEKNSIRLNSFDKYSTNKENQHAILQKNKLIIQTYTRIIKRIKEFVLSSPTIKIINQNYKPAIQEHKNNVKEFLKLLSKMYKIKLPLLEALDLKVVIKDYENQTCQIHSHFIAPAYDQKIFDANKWMTVKRALILKKGISIHPAIGRYKNKQKIISYFALIMSGRYTVNGEHHKGSFADFLTPLDYLINFYGSRSFGVRGIRESKVINFSKDYFDWLSAIWCIRIPEVCPYCSSNNLKLVRNDFFEEDELGDPPPNSLLEGKTTIPYSLKYRRILKNYSHADILRIKRILRGKTNYFGSNQDLFNQFQTDKTKIDFNDGVSDITANPLNKIKETNNDI